MRDKANSPQKILLIKNRAMGDAIIGLSSVQYLSDICPDSKIFYFTPSWIQPLFAQIKTQATEILGFKLQKLRDYIILFKQIRKIRPDCIIELHQSSRTKILCTLYSWLFRIPYYFHNHHSTQGDILDQGQVKPVIQRDLDGVFTACQKMGFVQQKVPHYLDYPPKLNSKQSVETHKRRIIFGIVATRTTKQWPLGYFYQLLSILKNHYPDIEIIIPLSKGLMDKKIADQWNHLDSLKQSNLVFESLDKLPGLFSTASLYIGNDTGIKHLAVSVGIPTITLFGPEDPLEWHPYEKNKHPYFFHHNKDIPCRVRTAHFCGLEECDQPIKVCMTKTDPVQVFSLAQNFLSVGTNSA